MNPFNLPELSSVEIAQGIELTKKGSPCVLTGSNGNPVGVLISYQRVKELASEYSVAPVASAIIALLKTPVDNRAAAVEQDRIEADRETKPRGRDDSGNADASGNERDRTSPAVEPHSTITYADTRRKSGRPRTL